LVLRVVVERLKVLSSLLQPGAVLLAGGVDADRTLRQPLHKGISYCAPTA
jgi:tRNA A37 threonylcarbamoyltransferase TsaD